VACTLWESITATDGSSVRPGASRTLQRSSSWITSPTPLGREGTSFNAACADQFYEATHRIR
jgi:hypothetical protein